MRDAEVLKTKDGKQVAVEGFDLKAFAKKHKWKIAGGVLAIGGFVFIKKKIDKRNSFDEVFKTMFGDDTENGDRNLFKVTWPSKDKAPGYTEVIKDFKLGEFSKDYKELSIPDDIKSAMIEELWMEGDDVLGIMNDIPITYLGEFGKELKEKIPELKDKDFAHLACVGFTKYNMDGPSDI